MAVRTVTANLATPAIQGAATLDLIKSRDLAAPLTTPAVQGTATLVVNKDLEVAADLETPAVQGAARMELLFSGDVPPRSDLRLPTLLGRALVAKGPVGSVVVAGTRSPVVSWVYLRTSTGPIEARTLEFSAPIRSMTSGNGRLFVLTEADELHVLDNTSLLGEVEKTVDLGLQDADARLWAADDLGASTLWGTQETDFVVVVGNGVMQIRSDSDLAVRAEIQTGLYRSEALVGLYRFDLRRHDTLRLHQVWDFIVYSRTSARARLFRFTDLCQFVITPDETIEVAKRSVSFAEELAAPNVEGPEEVHRLVDQFYGFYGSPSDMANTNDDPWGPHRTFRHAEGRFVTGPAGFGTTAPDVLRVPIEDFRFTYYGAFLSPFVEQGELTYIFQRRDGSEIDRATVFAQWTTGTGTVEPYPLMLTVTPGYGYAHFVGYKRTGSGYRDGARGAFTIIPPAGTHQVLIQNNSASADGTWPRIWITEQDIDVAAVMRRRNRYQIWDFGGSVETPRILEAVADNIETLMSRDVLWDEKFDPSVGNVPDEPNTEVPKLNSYRTVVGDAWTLGGFTLPRDRVLRVVGGYLHVHASLGRVSRHIFYPEEITAAEEPQPEPIAKLECVYPESLEFTAVRLASSTDDGASFGRTNLAVVDENNFYAGHKSWYADRRGKVDSWHFDGAAWADVEYQYPYVGNLYAAGSGVGVSGDGAIVVVGADGDDLVGVPQGGSVHGYDRTASTNALSVKGDRLTASPATNERFGTGMALSQDGSVLATAKRSAPANSTQGEITVGVVNTATWTSFLRSVDITPPGAGTGWLIGSGLNQTGDNIVLNSDASELVFGADGANSGAGSVFVYTSSDNWLTAPVLAQTISPPPASGGTFGVCINVDDSWTWMVITSGQRFGSDPVGAHLYENVAGTWTYRETLVPSYAEDGDACSAAFKPDDPNWLVIGNPEHDGDDPDTYGALAVWEKVGGVWFERGAIRFAPQSGSDMALGEVVRWARGSNRIFATASYEPATSDPGGVVYAIDLELPE